MPPKSSPSSTLTETLLKALRTHPDPDIRAFGITSPREGFSAIKNCFLQHSSSSQQRKATMIKIHCRVRVYHGCFIIVSDEKWNVSTRIAKINKDATQRFLDTFNITELPPPSSEELKAFNEAIGSIFPSFRRLLSSPPPASASPAVALVKKFLGALRSHSDPNIVLFGVVPDSKDSSSRPARNIIDGCFSSGEVGRQRKAALTHNHCQVRSLGERFIVISEKPKDGSRNIILSRKTVLGFLNAFNINIAKLPLPLPEDLKAFNEVLGLEMASQAAISSSSLSSGATSSTASSSSSSASSSSFLSSSSISTLQDKHKHKHSDDGNLSDDPSKAAKRTKYRTATSMTATIASAATTTVDGSAAGHTDDVFLEFTESDVIMASAAIATDADSTGHIGDVFSESKTTISAASSSDRSGYSLPPHFSRDDDPDNEDLTGFWSPVIKFLNDERAAAQATVRQAVAAAQAELAARATATPCASTRGIRAHFTANTSSAAATGAPSATATDALSATVEETKEEKKPPIHSAVASSHLPRISFLSRNGVPLADPSAATTVDSTPKDLSDTIDVDSFFI